MWLQTGFIALFQPEELQPAEFLLYMYFFTIWYHTPVICFKGRYQRNNSFFMFLLDSK